MSLIITEELRVALESAFNKTAKSLGPIQIGTKEQFPYGWRKSAKGRTVWRILEEAITQNLERRLEEFGFERLEAAASEVGVYDFTGKFKHINSEFFVNIKSAVAGARTNKDDISKAEKLLKFFVENPDRRLFVASFVMEFNANMSVDIKQAIVIPTMWIPDIYVNPSNNGNLQSSKYKDINLATRRSNSDFIEALKAEILVAKAKKQRAD